MTVIWEVVPEIGYGNRMTQTSDGLEKPDAR